MKETVKCLKDGYERFDLASLMILLKGYLDITVFGVLGFMRVSSRSPMRSSARCSCARGSNRLCRPSQSQVALTRHLTVVTSSVASNAPYIGLLGTVLGIWSPFHDLSQVPELSASAVMLTGAGV